MMMSMRMLTSPAAEYVPVTKANNDLAGGTCRGLLVGTAGTANLMQHDGTIRENVPLEAGINPIMARQVRTGGDADDIWALY
jgi:hypothetical protein